jgi:FAD/FMN-containing dehydrogenase/Fe-S oxidoreductase
VAFPRCDDDIRELIALARRDRTSLIPRGAGTSLAGQVVGSGIVVDLGRHLNRILQIDAARRRVRVQPGVVRNELNQALKPHGLHFAPETSSANRAMIGGMVGNNSCGSNSIVYGSVRDHLISARGFLSDGSEVTLGPLSAEEFRAKCEGPDTLEARAYRLVRALVTDPRRRQSIRDSFPKPEVTRRNTGYALDALLHAEPFNLCRLIAGSEGTLFLGVEFELNCELLPPPGALMCAHFATMDEALRAVLIAMRHRPSGCELIDRPILEASKHNLEQARNRFFVQGDPRMVLVVEHRSEDRAELEARFATLERELRAGGLGYAFPTIWGDDCHRVWELRRTGQGVVNNLPGEAQPREVIEDTAVAVADLPAYIAELDGMLRGKHGVDCIYYAHAGAGELHIRPLFDLKTAEGLRRFRAIATDVAHLVKRYGGSLSGEHGDGRLRGEFIQLMVGDECYGLMQLVKQTFDPDGIFNPGKIIATPPMDTSLRHGPSDPDPQVPTYFDFGVAGGILRAAERCTGIGECRKSHLAGGTMCPSYMATRNERDSTRARANALREMLLRPGESNPWTRPELDEVMDLCLGCKACKSECPSSIDMARMKAEWLQHKYEAKGVPLRVRLTGRYAAAMRLASRSPALYNALVTAPGLSSVLKKIAGLAPNRSFPRLPKETVRAWHRRNAARLSVRAHPRGRVHLFCDEFTNYPDAAIGIAAIQALDRLGYEVILPDHSESARTQLSKGLVREARTVAEQNVAALGDLVSDEAPLVGIEPSALLGFRDEYPDLVSASFRPRARALAGRSLLIDEFLAREADRQPFPLGAFTSDARQIRLHGHCHQKALSSVSPTVKMLQLPPNYRVEIIPSGCCGMAGSFGYEPEHYEISQQIGELVLFPAVRATPLDTLIAAPGTSCREQIHGATGRRARHPIEILNLAMP